MPLWIFTLGRAIFDRGHLIVPYARIASFAVGLIIPLGIGLLLQRYCPRVAKILVRILKSFSSLLILFIVVFAIITNLYLFQLFTWQVHYNTRASYLIRLMCKRLIMLASRLLLPAWGFRGLVTLLAGLFPCYSDVNMKIVWPSQSRLASRTLASLYLS